MSTIPRPPFLPNDLGQFAESLPARAQEWHAYASTAYEYIENTQITLADANDKSHPVRTSGPALRHELDHLEPQYHEEIRELDARSP
jgi:hypothetical protein